MFPRCVRAAAVAALLLCALAAPAAAVDGALVAQIDEAQPTPTPPPLTDDPQGLDEGPEPTPTPAPTASPEAGPHERLPDTGAEPAFLVVAGLGLLALGAGLRRTADEVLEP